MEHPICTFEMNIPALHLHLQNQYMVHSIIIVDIIISRTARD
jgi:hypothetical protein